MDIESKKRNGGKGGVGVGVGEGRKGFVCLLEFGSTADEMSEEGSRELGKLGIPRRCRSGGMLIFIFRSLLGNSLGVSELVLQNPLVSRYQSFW